MKYKYNIAIIIMIFMSTLLFGDILDDNKVKIYNIKFKKIRTENGILDGLRLKIKNISNKTIVNLGLTIYFKDKNDVVIFEDTIYPIIEWKSYTLKPNYIYEMPKDEYFIIKGIPSEWDKNKYDIKVTNLITKKQKAIDMNKLRNKEEVFKRIEELYGDSFKKLNFTQQKFILDNQENIRRITQQVLNRVARVNLPSDLHVNASNIVEFNLHPNRSISNLHFIKKSGCDVLDDTTEETIKYSYDKYPKPTVTTPIRYQILYNLKDE